MQWDFGAPLKYDQSKRGYFYTDDSFSLPDIVVSQEEVLALLLSRNLLSYVSEGLISRAISRFGKKLFSSIGGIGLSQAMLDESFSATWNGYSPAQAGIFQEASQALLHSRPLAFSYSSPASNKKTDRIVEPHHLQHYMGSWVLIAWCRKRSDWRKFYLSRMDGIRVREDTFSRRPAEEWEHLLEKGFGIFQGKTTFPVTLRLTPFRARWIREQVWHPEQVMKELPDGGLELTFPAADLREVKLKVMQFGADVEVVEPEELRELVREEIARMVKNYEL
jgi:predicted DNA-binding transcriptional regulator YafY